MAHRTAPSPLPVALLLCALSAACSPRSPLPPSPPTERYAPTAGLPGGLRVLHEEDAAETFFDRPWPSELRRKADGRLDLSNFPGERALLLGQYVEQARREMTGYALAPVVYFRFSGSFEVPELGASASSPVFLVDIDPQSPDRGTFFPLRAKRSPDRAAYVPGDTLQVRVEPGILLRPSTLYAAVVRRDFASPPLGTPLSFEATKATEPRASASEERARQHLRPAYDALAALGVRRGDIASLTTFRTHDPRSFTRSLLDHARGLRGEEAPRLLSAAWEPRLASPSYRVLRGMYCTPSYQQQLDQAPFARGGGTIEATDGGPRLAPIPPGSPHHHAACGPLLRARFLLSVPTTPPPPEGYPLMVSAHGTFGDAGSFLGERDFAGWAARRGIAVVSTDQPLHGGKGEAPRPGSTQAVPLSSFGLPLPFELDANMLFYNPLTPSTARGNMRQAMVDATSLLGLFAGLDLGAARGPAGEPVLAPADGAVAPRFRKDRLMLGGHSQGSQSLAVVGALDPRVRGVLLSGSGGDVRYGVLQNKEVDRFRGLVLALLRFSPGELDEMHPLMTLLESLTESIDPSIFAPYYQQPAGAARSVLHFEGLNDGYNPMAAAETLAVAMRAQPIAPLLRPVAGLDLLGLKAAPAVEANALGGQATIALAQIAPEGTQDGHFVVYHRPEAWALIDQFLAALAEGQVPRLGAPR